MNAPSGEVAAATAIDAKGLAKHYGDIAAVAGLDLRIGEGEFFGLLGPNGSGKTTTIHMLATLVRPSSGSATVAGHEITRNPVAVRASIGLVFQESALDRNLTVAENLRFAGMLHGLAPAVITQRAGALLEMFGIADKLNQSAATLSGGQRRALDIIRGVIHEPRVLFLDEPTIGLDLPVRRRIWRFIDGLRQRNRMTVLLTTHYLEEAEPCDRVSFIRKGAMVSTGTPRKLIDELGKHIVEFESDKIEALMGALEPTLGKGLREGQTATFRLQQEDTSELAKLQHHHAGLIGSVRVRRPNLNDVFIWTNAGSTK